MPSFLILAALGVGAYLVLSSKSASASSSPQASQPGAPAYATPGQFGSSNPTPIAAPQPILSQADAYAAQQMGLTPQQYVDSGYANYPLGGG